MKDYYTILGLKRGASKDEVTAAYRKLMLQYHPDRNQGDAAAEEKAKEINEAYTAITNGAADRPQGGPRQGWGFPGFGAAGNPFADFFKQASFSSGFGPQQRGPRPGGPVRLEMKLPLLDAILGGERGVTFEVTEECGCLKPCEDCGGRGVVLVKVVGGVHMTRPCESCRGQAQQPDPACSTCSGKGQVPITRDVKLTIPEGIQAGQTLGVQGAGFPGSMGGPPGDLLVTIHVEIPKASNYGPESIEKLKDVFGGPK